MFGKLLLVSTALIYPVFVYAQTCNSTVSETTPTSRFTDQSDGTALDSTTGLVWKRCSEGQVWDGSSSCTGTAATYSWAAAFDRVNTLNTSGGFANQTDWRLPNYKELSTLVEYQCYQPSINASIFPDTSSDNYWVSSLYVPSGNEYQAWGVNFGGGYGIVRSKINAYSIRLVRGGV